MLAVSVQIKIITAQMNIKILKLISIYTQMTVIYIQMISVNQ
jgi:hypothetical protein